MAGASLLLIAVISVLAKQVHCDTAGVRYLVKYGYLKSLNTGSSHSKSDISKALKRFQQFSNIQATGTFDKQTKTKMVQIRCGLPDVVLTINDAARKKRFAVQGSKWHVTNLKYTFQNFGADLKQKEVRRAFATAARLWSEVTQISLTESGSSSADIRVKFAQYVHGDHHPFDGPGGEIAHAFFPQYGDIHLDDSETFTVDNDNPLGIDLVQVAAHQFGHALGLSHSEVPGSVMRPFYPGYTPFLALHSDDVMAMNHLYGGGIVATSPPPPKKATSTKSHPAPTRPVAPPSNPEIPSKTIMDWCGKSLDAISRAANGDFLLFKRSLVWKMGSNGISKGYPRGIQTIWKEVPSDLDAVLKWKKNLFFFKGFHCWKYSGVNPAVGNPKIIKGLSEHIDAAFLLSGNGLPYLTSSGSYYIFNPDTLAVEQTKQPSQLLNLPSMIDAAVLDARGNTYFFKNNTFYMVKGSIPTANGIAPQSKDGGWLGCKKVFMKQLQNANCSNCGGESELNSSTKHPALVFVVAFLVIMIYK